jgi:2-oxoglutarate dehydrogenase E2 component (dihydrolipoamide succinyltransferase)
MIVEVKMPDMGSSVKEVLLVKWHKQPGDEVLYDETLFEVSSDKVIAEVPSPFAGKLLECCFEEGAAIPIDHVIARIEQ